MTRSEIEQVARRWLGHEARFDGLSDQVVKMVVLGATLPGGLPLSMQTGARIDEAFAELARRSSAAARGDATDPGRELRLDGPADPETAKERMRRDALEAWKRPLRSQLVIFDRADGAEQVQELEPRRNDSDANLDTAAAARAKARRDSEDAWMRPLSAGLRAP